MGLDVTGINSKERENEGANNVLNNHRIEN